MRLLGQPDNLGNPEKRGGGYTGVVRPASHCRQTTPLTLSSGVWYYVRHTRFKPIPGNLVFRQEASHYPSVTL